MQDFDLSCFTLSSAATIRNADSSLTAATAGGSVSFLPEKCETGGNVWGSKGGKHKGLAPW